VKSEILYSNCVPKVMDSGDLRSLCMEDERANDFYDWYTQGTYVREQSVIKVWLIILIILAALLVLTCSLSCYYNYKLHFTGRVPFRMPRCCPDCLFPRPPEDIVVEQVSDDNGSRRMTAKFPQSTERMSSFRKAALDKYKIIG